MSDNHYTYMGPQDAYTTTYGPLHFADADVGPSYAVKANMRPQSLPYPVNANLGGQSLPYSANANTGSSYSANTNVGPQVSQYSTNANMGPQGLPYPPGANLGPPGLLYSTDVGPQGSSYSPNANLGPYSANVGPQGPPYPTSSFVAGVPSLHSYSILHIDSTIIDYMGPSPYTNHLVSTFNNDFMQPFWEPPATFGQTVTGFPAATAPPPMQNPTSVTSGASPVGNPPNNMTNPSIPLSIKEPHFCHCHKLFPLVISLIEKSIF